MELQDFVSTFLSSEHGRGAIGALAGQGIDAGKAQELVTHAATAGHEHVASQSSGLLGDNFGKSFLAAFTAGIMKGDGLLGALGDGVEGALVGRVAEALAQRAGLDPNVAATVAAAVTPYVVSFAKSKLA